MFLHPPVRHLTRRKKQSTHSIDCIKQSVQQFTSIIYYLSEIRKKKKDRQVVHVLCTQQSEDKKYSIAKHSSPVVSVSLSLRAHFSFY